MAHEVSSEFHYSTPRYGDVAAAGNARVHLGDIHNHHNPPLTGSDLDAWKVGRLEALQRCVKPVDGF